MAARVLLVRPDAGALAHMTTILSGYFAVLAARSPDEARRLMERYGPCDLALCEVGPAPVAELAWTSSPHLRDMAVVALCYPPCPRELEAVVRAGRIQGVCLLPLAPETLLDTVREVLRHPAGDTSPSRRLPAACVLTDEEIRFLLGRMPARPACTPAT